MQKSIWLEEIDKQIIDGNEIIDDMYNNSGIDQFVDLNNRASRWDSYCDFIINSLPKEIQVQYTKEFNNSLMMDPCEFIEVDVEAFQPIIAHLTAALSALELIKKQMNLIAKINKETNMGFLDGFGKTKFKVIKVDGLNFEMDAVEGEKGKEVHVDHDDIKPNVIEDGDILEAIYGNGTKKKYIVIDPGFYDEDCGFPAHYQIQIKPYNNASTTHIPHSINNTNGTLIINQNSPSANISVLQDLSIFSELSEKIKTENSIDNKKELLALVEQMKNNANNKTTFAQHYGQFISFAANHMTILAPFLPLLAKHLE